MSEIKTYKCDVCKNVVKQAEDITTLRLQLVGPFVAGSPQYNKSTMNSHICTICSEKLGMKLPKHDPKMTIDSQLCDFLADFINAVVDGR